LYQIKEDEVLVRIVLIAPPSPQRDSGDPNGLPLGLAMLGAMVHETAEITIVDAYTNALSIEKTIEEALRFEPDITGIGIPFTFSQRPALEIASGIKSGLPGTFIVLGGIQASVRSDVLINRPDVDAVAVGEAEITFFELVDRFKQGGRTSVIKNPPPGLTIINTDKEILYQPRPYIEDLDTLPRPAYDLLPGFTNNYTPRLITSRGCLFGCPYCASCAYWGSRFRAHSPARVVKDFVFLKGRYGVRRVSLADDTFNMDPDRSRKIAGLLIERNIGIEWGTSCHPGLLTSDDLRLYHRAGMTGLFVGVESGSPEVLKGIGRTHDLVKTAELLEVATGLGIETHASFMIGLPGETESDIEMTLEYARNLDVGTLGFHIFHPLPGSEIGDHPEKYGITFEKPVEEIEGFGAIDAVAPVRTEHLGPMRILDYYYIARGIAEERMRRTKMNAGN